MAKPSDIRLLAVEPRSASLPFRAPLKFGGRLVTDCIVYDVRVEVKTRDGRRGTGYGSMPMGNVWAWPSQRLAPEATLQAMLAFAERMVAAAREARPPDDPLQLSHELQHRFVEAAGHVQRELALPEPLPELAQRVAASPLMAALFDAFGRAVGENAYNLLGPEFINRPLEHYLHADFAGEYLDRYTLRAPKPRMPLYHLVGAVDPLTDGDVTAPVADGLPETLQQWIAADGLTHLKIKLNGNDLRWDVDRVLAVEAAAREAQHRRGCRQWHYSLDFNEKCPDVQYVLDFLDEIEQRDPAALERVQYIEQPTHRDLRANPENRMHRAAQRKPVVIDESLLDLDSLLLAREMGYTGVALKACKGHADALLMGAAAQKYGMFLCVQDLTCVGRSFLHSASLAARIPTIAAIEGNGRQYCPEGNRGWDARYPGMFRIHDGTVHTAELDGPGLGFAGPGE